MRAQLLDGGPPGLLDLIRRLGAVQLDPTNAVARSHLLVLWSRLGAYDPGELDRLLWHERALFEYWAHAASIVLTEDYPIHQLRMRRYLRGEDLWRRRVREWLAANDRLRRHVLAELRRRGPLRLRDFEDRAVESWTSTGWTGGRNVSRMLDFLWAQGKVLVSRREGQQRFWDLAERCLPPETLGQRSLPVREIVHLATQRSLRALGVATAEQIRLHFTPGRFPGLEQVLAGLERQGLVLPVEVEGLPGRWYVHAEDVPALEDEQPSRRTTLLSPFDNLIRDRDRTESLFGFHFRLEIYVPAAKRRYGFFVLPILHGDRLIGRIDPVLDRKAKVLRVNAVHSEPGAPDAGEDVATAIGALADWLGAEDVAHADRVPKAWRRALRN